MNKPAPNAFVALACGGTGGHLFPGLAVGNQLLRLGCEVLLMVSPKEVDQHAVKSASGMEVATLPAIGLSRGRLVGFASGFCKSLRAARESFRARPPQAVLGMGGFTSAPPVLAGKACGALTFLHESNTIPGRANRWLAHLVDQAFVGFPSAAERLSNGNVLCTGTPVRPPFQPADPVACRLALGLRPNKPVLLITGGSQGASRVNELVLQAALELAKAEPELQILHLTGVRDFEQAQAAYAACGIKAIVRPFLTEMALALGAATVAVSRAGASSLAELAAMRLPSILIPFPSAADNHQWHNARALADAGAALLLEQKAATPAKLGDLVLKLLRDPAAQSAMREELVRWHKPNAAELIAEKIVALMKARGLGHWEHSPSPIRAAQDESFESETASTSLAASAGQTSARSAHA
jgi:UDP-N-acetylglucosamine--N-acetylmuramyl-(pentapeptide) pyrophosphoryl-undecaprenol N-acetylglucosamine transferase